MLGVAGGAMAQAGISQPRWVTGHQLVELFAMQNGDAAIVSTAYNRVMFTYQYLDPTREPEFHQVQWPLGNPDRVVARVCGNVVHVVAEWSDGSLYSTAWELPVEMHQQFLPLVCGGEG